MKPTTTKKNQTKSDKTPFYKRKWVIICLASFVIVSSFFVGQSIYSKNIARSKVQQTVDTSKGIFGSIEYSGVEDSGCTFTERGWFGGSTSCGYVGNVVIKSDSFKREELKRLDKVLIDQGYKRQSVFSDENAFQKEIARGEAKFRYIKVEGEYLRSIAYLNYFNPQIAKNPPDAFSPSSLDMSNGVFYSINVQYAYSRTGY